MHKAPFECEFCGLPSWVDPSDQSPPPDYCHSRDHGEPDEVETFKWGPHCPFSLTFWADLNDCGPLSEAEMVRYKHHRAADMARYQEHVRR